jgi:hypothetical protein
VRDYLGDDVEAIGRDGLPAGLRRGMTSCSSRAPARGGRGRHIRSARSIPLDELEDRLAELPADREVVAYCRGPFCVYARSGAPPVRRPGATRGLEDGWPNGASTTSRQDASVFHFETGRQLAERLGYRPATWDRIPPDAIASFAGVGCFIDLAAIAPGEVVLDLGSGSGTDDATFELPEGLTSVSLLVRRAYLEVERTRKSEPPSPPRLFPAPRT